MSSFHARGAWCEKVSRYHETNHYWLVMYCYTFQPHVKSVTVKGGHWVGRPAMGISCSGNYVSLSLRLTKRPESRSIMSYIKRHLRKAIVAFNCAYKRAKGQLSSRSQQINYQAEAL